MDVLGLLLVRPYLLFAHYLVSNAYLCLSVLVFGQIIFTLFSSELAPPEDGLSVCTCVLLSVIFKSRLSLNSSWFCVCVLPYCSF